MSVAVIVGGDDFLVEAAARERLSLVEGADVEVVDSRLSRQAEMQLADLRRVRESVFSPPLFAPAKATWWKNVSFLPSSGKGRGGPSKEVKEKLEAFARAVADAPPPENQVLVISGESLLQNSIFAKTMQKVGEVVYLNSSKGEQRRNALRRANEFAAAAGLRFAPGAAEAFVARVGTDTRSLASEVGKLDDYLGAETRTVTAAAIAQVSSPGANVETELWDLTDALGERNLGKTLAALGNFEGESNFAVMITTAAEKFFRTLYALKDAASRGKTQEATGSMHPFVAQKNLAFARNWSAAELRMARLRMARLREKAVTVSGAIDEQVSFALVRAVLRQEVR